MAKIDDCLRILDNPMNSQKLVRNNQSTQDIIAQVLEQHRENKKQAKEISHIFDGGNCYETCKNIWNFLKYEVPYQVEPSSKQTTKTISRMLHDAKLGKGSDCKHYSGFTGNILEACGYNNWVYRFAGYSDFNQFPTHVYVVANDSDGKIYCDAVIGYFDTEKSFKTKIDKKMALYKLSGIDDAEVGGIKESLQKLGNKVKDGAKEIKNKALTVSLVVPRAAFLGLIRLNVHGWATGLSKMDFNELKWWVDWFGGNRSELLDVIKKGAKEKRILGVDDPSIGFVFETAIASAAPIVLKVQKVLEMAEKISNGIEKIKGNKTVQAVQKAGETFKQITGKSVSDIIFKKDAGQSTTATELSQSDLKTPTDEEANKVAEAIINKTYVKKDTPSNLPILPIAIGAGALLFFMSKK